MAITEQQIQTALKELTDPNTGKDYVTGKEAKNIKIDGNNVALDILLGYPANSSPSPALAA
jgi:ATP-binding protein involved in chromosome partitioning